MARSKQEQMFHKILAVEIRGGFLDKTKMKLESGLNCLIGGRGTGKTSILEFVRYALDTLPDPARSQKRHREILRLIEANLRNGTISVQIETKDGTHYEVRRSLGEDPLVLNGDGEPTDIHIGNDIVFSVDVYSQNEIEDIANESLFQLELIDRRIQREIQDVEREIGMVSQDLRKNASIILDKKKRIAELVEQIKELPDITAKLTAFNTESKDTASQSLRSEQEGKSHRGQEVRLFEELNEFYDYSVEALVDQMNDLKSRFQDVIGTEYKHTANGEILTRAKEGAQTAVKSAIGHVDKARRVFTESQKSVSVLRHELKLKHREQDKSYQKLIDASQAEEGREKERIRLAQRQDELLKSERNLKKADKELNRALRERANLRAKLSELRDNRYSARKQVSDELNAALEPMIRVRIEQSGNTDEYRNELMRALRGSRMRYAHLVDRIVDRIPPSELVLIIQDDDHQRIEDILDIDRDRATRLLLQLKDSEAIFAIETVELHDKPVIELKDGARYKDSACLSTGQKCTTILPILLLESERPLLIDQPEDNLDNAFVYDTVVKSIQQVAKKRQLLLVTHNPNIPVLGEAEHVIVLDSDGQLAKIAKSGTVDEVREDIETLLEGGAEAFRLRMKRYGY